MDHVNARGMGEWVKSHHLSTSTKTIYSGTTVCQEFISGYIAVCNIVMRMLSEAYTQVVKNSQ